MSHRYPLLATVVAAVISVKIVNLVVNLFMFPTLRRTAEDATDLTGVALLIPMRNEAERLPATLSGLLSSGAATVTFLDDGSTDGSAALVKAAATKHESWVEIIVGQPRPPEWAGKTWACAQLAKSAAAKGADILVFCDADVVLGPGALKAAVREMRSQRAAVFSVFPGQQVMGWSERLLIPLIDNTLLCYLPFPLLTAPVPAAATANGSLLAFTAKGYRQLDAFTAVKSALVEDVSIARLTRAAGLKLGLALGGPMIRARMFSSFDELVKGMGRGLSPIARSHPVLLITGWLAHVLVYSLPVLLAPKKPIWRYVVGLGILERALIEAKTGGRDWVATLLTGIAPVLAAPVIRQALKSTQTWKGRTYQ